MDGGQTWSEAWGVRAEPPNMYFVTHGTAARDLQSRRHLIKLSVMMMMMISSFCKIND